MSRHLCIFKKIYLIYCTKYCWVFFDTLKFGSPVNVLLIAHLSSGPGWEVRPPLSQHFR